MSHRCHSWDHNSKSFFIRTIWFLFGSTAFTALTQNKTQLPFFTATKMLHLNSWWCKVRDQRLQDWSILFDTYFLEALQLCTSLCLVSKPPAFPTIKKDCVKYKNQDDTQKNPTSAHELCVRREPGPCKPHSPTSCFSFEAAK